MEDDFEGSFFLGPETGGWWFGERYEALQGPGLGSGIGSLRLADAMFEERTAL